MIELIIKYSLFILLVLLWLTGFLFDLARINKKVWEYPAHLIVEVSMLFVWWLTGLNWGWFLLAANVGWFVMGLMQHLSDNKPLFWFGDGKGNTPELICKYLNRWLFHEDEITKASIYFRIALLIISILLLLL